MPLWQWLLDVAAVLLVLVLLYGGILVLRRRVLSRHGGTFELSHRFDPADSDRGWVLGLGRYSGDNLEWFRVFTISPLPKRVYGRSQMSYDGRRTPTEGERHALYPGHVVIGCTTADGPIELAMSAESLTGFQSWLESRTPGTDWSR